MQREILVSILIQLYILCPQGSDEVTKSSVRMQRYTLKRDRCAVKKKMLFQSSTVLFLSKYVAHIQRGKNEASVALSLSLFLAVFSMEHQVYGHEETW